MNHEIRANEYNDICIKRTLLVMWMVLFFNELGIFVLDKYLVRYAALFSTILLLSSVLVVKICGKEKRWIKYYILTMEILAISVVSIFLSYHALIAYALAFLMAAHYTNNKMTVYTYILTVIGVVLSALLSYKVGLTDLNMVAMYTGNILKEGNVYEMKIRGLDLKLSLEILLLYVLPRCILLYLYAVMALSLAKRSRDMQVYQQKVVADSRYDDMTGLHNKKAYSEDIKIHKNLDGKVGIIYFDVNGLKKVNDTLGHEKGDEFIVNFSKSILKIVDDGINGYRIGGDEFVVIVNDASSEKLKALIMQWKSALDVINASIKGQKITAAYGCSYGRCKDITSLIEEADKLMYVCKKEMKNERG